MLLFSTKNQNKWNTLKHSGLKLSESWSKNNQGRDKIVINHADSEDLLTDQEKFENVTESKYLGQTTHVRDTTTKKKSIPGSEQWGGVLEQNKEIPHDRQLPISLKYQVVDLRVLKAMTYDCQTWFLNKQMTNKPRTAVRAMETKKC